MSVREKYLYCHEIHQSISPCILEMASHKGKQLKQRTYFRSLALAVTSQVPTSCAVWPCSSVNKGTPIYFDRYFCFNESATRLPFNFWKKKKERNIFLICTCTYSFPWNINSNFHGLRCDLAAQSVEQLRWSTSPSQFLPNSLFLESPDIFSGPKSHLWNWQPLSLESRSFDMFSR